MTDGKFGRRSLDQLYAISLDWLFLVTRLPLAGGKTGCSKLVPAKKAVLLDGSANLLKYISVIQDTVNANLHYEPSIILKGMLQTALLKHSSGVSLITARCFSHAGVTRTKPVCAIDLGGR